MFTADISPVGPAPPVTLTWTHIDTGATWKHLDQAVFQKDIGTLGLLRHVETAGWQFTSSMWLKKGQRGSSPEPPFPWTSGVTQSKRSYSHIFLVQKASPIVLSSSVWSWLWTRADLPQYSHKAGHTLWGSSRTPDTLTSGYSGVLAVSWNCQSESLKDSGMVQRQKTRPFPSI